MSKPRRPALVTAVAVVNFIYGGLGVLCLTCVGAMIGLLAVVLENPPPPQPGQPDQAAMLKEFGEVMQAIPGFVPINVAYFVVEFLLLLGLIAAGFGLLRMKRWARTFCLVYAAYTLLVTVGLMAYFYAVVHPALPRAIAEVRERKQAKAAPGAAPPAPNQMLDSLGNSMGGSVLDVAFAIGLLVVLNLPDVRRAFREASAGGPGEEAPPALPPEGSDERFRSAEDRYRSGDTRFGPDE
jgi:hypothetical protein